MENLVRAFENAYCVVTVNLTIRWASNNDFIIFSGVLQNEYGTDSATKSYVRNVYQIESSPRNCPHFVSSYSQGTE